MSHDCTALDPEKNGGFGPGDLFSHNQVGSGQARTRTALVAIMSDNFVENGTPGRNRPTLAGIHGFPSKPTSRRLPLLRPETSLKAFHAPQRHCQSRTTCEMCAIVGRPLLAASTLTQMTDVPQMLPTSAHMSLVHRNQLAHSIKCLVLVQLENRPSLPQE